jgi:hypothetical protein
MTDLDGHGVTVLLHPYQRFQDGHYTGPIHNSDVDIALSCGYGFAPSEMQAATTACPD